MFGSKKNNKKTRNTKKNNTTVNNNRNNSNNRNYGNTYGRNGNSQYGTGNRYSNVGKYRVSENVFSTGAGMNSSRGTYGSGRFSNSSRTNNTRNQNGYGYTNNNRMYLIIKSVIILKTLRTLELNSIRKLPLNQRELEIIYL